MYTQKVDILNYLPSYPAIDDPEFIYKISRLEEMQKLKLSSFENVPIGTDTPLMSQALEQRMFNPHTPYPGEIVFHGMGTGKTCTAEFIIDTFKDSPAYKAVIISPSDMLMQAFASDIAKKCATQKFKVKFTGDLYEKKVETATAIAKKKSHSRDEVVEQINVHIKKSEDRASTKKVKKTYHMMTIADLIKITKQENSSMIKEFSHTLVFIDEAHLIRKDTKGGYNAILKFLQNIVGARVFLLTGTPIWDKVEDIASLINLLLPMDLHLKTGVEFSKYIDDKDNLTLSAVSEFKKAFKGRVSFLREMLSSASRNYKGVTAPWLKHMVIFPVAMGVYQEQHVDEIVEKTKELALNDKKEVNPKNLDEIGYENWNIEDYNEMVKRERKNKAILIDTKNSTKANEAIKSFRQAMADTGFQINAREATSFIAPDYSIVNKKVITTDDKPLYGKDFQDRAIVWNNDNKVWSYRDAEYLKYIKHNIDKFANKLEFIIDHALSHRNEVGWIYNKSVDTGSGVINYALILQELKDDNGNRQFIWAKTLADVKRKTNIPKFIVISSKEGTFNTPNSITEVLEFISSKENRYGEYCQFVFGTKKASLGLTLKNARWAIVSTLHWNESELDQALARIYRVGSHDNFDKPEEKYVNIYILASVKKANTAPNRATTKNITTKEVDKGYAQGKGFPVYASFTDYTTVDIEMAKVAEHKDYLSAQIYRIMKEESWNCAIAYGRNVLETDIPYSRFAGYNDINYTCDGYPEEFIDKSSKVWNYTVPTDEVIKSNYNLFYSIDLSLIESFKELFRNYGALEFKSICTLVSNDMITIMGTLKHMIETNVSILDRYGFTRYLEEDRNVFFLKNTLSKQPFTDSYYISNPIMNENIRLEDADEYRQLINDNDKIKNVCSSSARSDDVLVTLVESVNYKTKIFLIEELAVHDLERALKMFPKILHMSHNFVWHDLYQVEEKGIKYAKKEKNQIRLLAQGVWRFAHKGWELDEIEQDKEVAESQATISNNFDKDLSMKIRLEGNITNAGFVIKDLDTATGKTLGMACSPSWTKNRLYELIWNLSIYKMEQHKPTTSDPQKERVNLAKNIGKVERIIYGGDVANIAGLTDDDVAILNGYLRMNKAKLCEIVHAWFFKENLIKSTTIPGDVGE